ncbi:MAG: glycosyltransferase [Candidatus Altiarchaeota archaeon]|nr:glycosyltransferase [Candidatus Altiarchaeota archaeon]
MKILLASMEAAFENKINTYAGGLGILVGDKVKAAKDLKLNLDVVTFSYPGGYASNKVEGDKLIVGPKPWNPKRKTKSSGKYTIKTNFGEVEYELLRGNGFWMIHTPEFANRLYIEYSNEERLKKEVILGEVAAKLTAEKKYQILHMEESHAAFGGEALRKKGKKQKIVFTTHTPLPHGHENWTGNFVKSITGYDSVKMTKLALKNANYVNCVSRMQRDILNEFLDNRSDFVTNGVHTSWMHKKLETLVSSCVGDVLKKPQNMVNSLCIDTRELRDTKAKMNAELVNKINKEAYAPKTFVPGNFTIGIARRFTGYKRLDLILREWDMLENLAREKPIQIIYSGIAHPSDKEGINQIEAMLKRARDSKHVKIAYFPNYDMDIAKIMLAGSHAWLNVPNEEGEASGTSWMKAMMNATLLISTSAGSVPEYAIDKQNSLIIPRGYDEYQAKALLGKIRYAVNNDLTEMQKSAIATSAHLTARRMMSEYISKAYS